MAIKTLEGAREFVYGQPSLEEWRDALRDGNTIEVPVGLNQCPPRVIDYLLEHCIMQGFVIWSEYQDWPEWSPSPLTGTRLEKPMRVEKAGGVFQPGDYVRPRRHLIEWAQCSQCGWGREYEAYEVGDSIIDGQACPLCGVGPIRL